MKISSSYTGLALKEYRCEVTLRHSMNYAAALGDANPRYFDDSRPGGSLTPPMLTVALTWPVTANIWNYLPDPDFPTHLLMTQVHYSERLDFHRPLQPGMRLVIQGQIAAILPHRAGTLVTLRYDASTATGEPVFTEHIGGLLRGVTCEDAGRGAEALPPAPAFPQAGEPSWEQIIPVDPLASYLYDGCADLHFPIHTSPSFARSVGLPGIILQGTATLAHAAWRILDRHADGDPTRLKALGCRFGAMVMPGSQVCLRVLTEQGDHLHFDVLNAENQAAIRDGFVQIA